MTDPVRIANCSGFYGDRLSAASEMVDGGDIDFLTGDWLAELTIRTFLRNEVGLLCDVTEKLKHGSVDLEELLPLLEAAITNAAKQGKPYTKSGKNGVYERREELPERLRKVGRNRLQDMVQALLDNGRVTKSSTGKSGMVKWLDVPGGPFDRGDGQFEPGALRARG